MSTARIILSPSPSCSASLGTAAAQTTSDPKLHDHHARHR